MTNQLLSRLFFGIFLFSTVVLLPSCGEKTSSEELKDKVTSEKTPKEEPKPVEGWSDEDRQNIREELEAIRSDLESFMGEHTDEYINCYIDNLESAFSNPELIESKPELAQKISKECAISILSENEEN